MRAGKPCHFNLALAVQFPKGIVKINTYTTTYPRISIRKDQATVSLWSRIDAHAQVLLRKLLNITMLTASLSL